MGAPPEVIDNLVKSAPEPVCLVLPENWDAVQLLLRCQTQWRFSEMSGQLLGLDYAAVDVVMRRAKIEDESGELFTSLQVIEVAAVNAARG